MDSGMFFISLTGTRTGGPRLRVGGLRGGKDCLRSLLGVSNIMAFGAEESTTSRGDPEREGILPTRTCAVEAFSLPVCMAGNQSLRAMLMVGSLLSHDCSEPGDERLLLLIMLRFRGFKARCFIRELVGVVVVEFSFVMVNEYNMLRL